jgi:glycosyltransferase involved in cell wall biosynthesis
LPYYHEIKGQLHFHGRRSLEEGYALANDCEIGLCIIWPMKNSTDSYPTKLFEYMAIGLPAITSDFPLYRSVVESNQTGICVDPFSAKDIAGAIETIHKDVKKSEQMAQNGKMMVEKKYNWKSEESTLMAVYKELCRPLK